ncbi:MAG: uracil-DNA glycosylase [Thiomargarita sp.]|nr:uracil-DNA glycosylase [Thiomargarita sp.]
MTNRDHKSLHAQYLKTMGIQIWVRRTLPTESSHVAATPEPLQTEKTSDVQVNRVAHHTENALTTEKEKPFSKESIEPLSKERIEPSKESIPPSKENTMLDWDTLQNRFANCTDCELHKIRTQTVFGIGNRQADLMFIGEAPGADEDAQGEPFVGRAGILLNEMLYAIDLKIESVYMTNVIKCRPPENRNPHLHEIASCHIKLRYQIALVKPKLIIAVGRVAAHHLLSSDLAIGELRGQRFEYGKNKIPLIVTYHPAYLLRSPREKSKSWQDLQFIRQTMLSFST